MQRRTILLSSLSLGALLPSLGGLAGCGGGGNDDEGSEPDRATPVGTLAVSHHAAVTAADGSVVVIGGSRGQSTLSAAVDRFEPGTRRLTRIGELASGRMDHLAVGLADGRILVVGGITSLNVGPFAELVDPLRGTVAHAGTPALPRPMMAATRLADGRVLVSGGVRQDSAELWEPATNRWRLLPARMSQPRAGHSATLLADGRVLVAGGDAGPGGVTAAFAELWDPATEAFTPLAPSGDIEPRLLHAAWRAADGSVLVVGGEAPRTDRLVPLASAWRFEPATLRFGVAAGLGVARTLAVPVVGPDGSALLVGGQTVDERASGRLSRWSAGGGEVPLKSLPQARLWHSASRLPDGRVLVVGGEGSDGGFVTDMLMLERGR